MKSTSKQKHKNKNYNSERDKNIDSSKNNQIKQENIEDFFVFDEEIDNIIPNKKELKNKNKVENIKINEKEEQKENDNPKKLKVDYNVSSFITSSFRPDLYCPFGIISGNKYKLGMAPGKSLQKFEEEENEEEEEEKENKKEEDKESLSSEKENNEEIKASKLNRYYNLEQDISVKCHICGQVGHRKDVCPNYDIKFCYRCLSTSHEDRDCDQIKCFRCNKLGHKTYNCKVKDNKLFVCDRCHCVGHKKSECLIKPMEFSHKLLKYYNLTCINCGSNQHVLCSLVTRDLPILEKEDPNEIINDQNLFTNATNIDIDIDDEGSSSTPKCESEEEGEIKEIKEDKKSKKKKKKKKKEKNILENLKNEEIKHTIFCSLCGDFHRNEECPNKDEEKYSNKFDEQRKSLGKRILENKRKKEEEREQTQTSNFSFQKRYRDIDNKKYQENDETKSQNKYKTKYKDKTKYNNNKDLPLNEDDLSDNENHFNISSKNKYYKNYNNNNKNFKNNKKKNTSKFS